jgi:hypothetical protein
MSNNNQATFTREAITLQQFNVLLNTLATLQAGLREQPTEEAGVPGVHRLAGEARLALEATLLKTCARIDKIIDEESRWSLDRLFDVERRIDETLSTQNAASVAQKEAFEDSRRPCRILQPDLVKTPNGWIAFYGDVSNDASLITGVGESPADAMLAFDQSYHQKLTLAELPSGAGAPPKKRKKK